VECERCHSLAHAECGRTHGRCPTLGCAGRAVAGLAPPDEALAALRARLAGAVRLHRAVLVGWSAVVVALLAALAWVPASRSVVPLYLLAGGGLLGWPFVGFVCEGFVRRAPVLLREVERLLARPPVAARLWLEEVDTGRSRSGGRTHDHFVRLDARDRRTDLTAVRKRVSLLDPLLPGGLPRPGAHEDVLVHGVPPGPLVVERASGELFVLEA
jgi:hypothetical protein